jgi:hypothetical protein
MNDMSPVIIPKSDQISADDLLSGPITIRIASVDIRPGTEQPVSISFVGDEGRPWRPCKSMSRVLVSAWGPDAKLYAGRSVTLYRDAKVKWGGMEVGGIRISHLSHIDRDLVLALTATKGKKAAYTVKVLREAAAARAEVNASLEELSDDLRAWVDATRGAASNIEAEADLVTWWADIAAGDEYKALIDADKGEALALKAHVIAHKKALAAS